MRFKMRIQNESSKFEFNSNRACPHTMRIAMDDIPYSCIRVIYVLHLCAVGFALRNVRDIF